MSALFAVLTDPSSLPLAAVVGIFAACAALVGTAGVWMVTTTDRLADRTGLGEAITGAVFLGIATSLSGTVTSITAAWDGHASLAVSNAVGGIAAQTFFLAIGDMVYRKINLEHAAASATNLLQCALLVALLSLPLVAMVLPPLELWGIHIVSPLLVIGWIAGLRMADEVQRTPPWRAVRTADTKEDVPDEPKGGKTMQVLLIRFAGLALLLGLAGFVIARTGAELAARTGMDETAVGALLTAVATSLPELVTTIAAVRRGALTLAVGGIIGGNTFDVLFLALADTAYRDGSIYHAVGEREIFVIALSILMTAILLLGLLRRERKGFANIGFESAMMGTVYVLGVGVLVWA
ncbi:MAG: hypothetical protein WD270_06670 [Acetobacterales bacterium]